MQKITKALLLATLSLTSLMAKDGGMDLPSSTPINVFDIKDGQIGIGYMQFDVKLSLKDDYWEDKIGDVDFHNQGIIVTLPKNEETIIGRMFELSYTAGVTDSQLKEKHFVDSGNIYNNTYKKDGAYIGIRPSFSVEIYDSEMFKIKNATALHAVLYTMSGDFSVNNNNGLNYAYDETSYGIGLKPSTVVSGTFYPVHSFGISGFVGVSTFLALNITDYSSKNNSEEADIESAGYMSSVDPVYGFDLVYRGIFETDDTFNLSSVFTNKNNESSMETIVRYVFNF